MSAAIEDMSYQDQKNLLINWLDTFYPDLPGSLGTTSEKFAELHLKNIKEPLKHLAEMQEQLKQHHSSSLNIQSDDVFGISYKDVYQAVSRNLDLAQGNGLLADPTRSPQERVEGLIAELKNQEDGEGCVYSIVRNYNKLAAPSAHDIIPIPAALHERYKEEYDAIQLSDANISPASADEIGSTPAAEVDKAGGRGAGFL